MIKQHPVTVAAACVAALCVGVALFAVYTLVLRTPVAPLTYVSPSYIADRQVYAPGDTLVYTPALTVERAGITQVTRSFWDVDKGSFALLCDGTPAPTLRNDPRVFPARAHGKAVANRVPIKIPNLPPGRYLVSSSAVKPTGDGGEALSEVEFLIARPCRDNDR